MAPTWLDRQLLSEKHSSVDRGFGASVNQALRKRVDFLKEQGLAEIRGEHHSVPRNLLTRLRQWEIEGLAKTIEKETGRTHRPVVDGQRVRGVYRQVVTGASGRFALLDDGLGFSLVPWKPVIEQQLGRSIRARSCVGIPCRGARGKKLESQCSRSTHPELSRGIAATCQYGRRLSEPTDHFGETDRGPHSATSSPWSPIRNLLQSGRPARPDQQSPVTTITETASTLLRGPCDGSTQASAGVLVARLGAVVVGNGGHGPRRTKMPSARKPRANVANAGGSGTEPDPI